MSEKEPIMNCEECANLKTCVFLNEEKGCRGYYFVPIEYIVPYEEKEAV